MNNPWLPQKHRILNIIEETDLESTFIVEFKDPQIRHGQFFSSLCPRSEKHRFPYPVLPIPRWNLQFAE